MVNLEVPIDDVLQLLCHVKIWLISQSLLYIKILCILKFVSGLFLNFIYTSNFVPYQTILIILALDFQLLEGSDGFLFCILFFFFLTFYFKLEHSCLTLLWQLQVHSKVTQPYMYMYPFSPITLLSSRLHITLNRVPFPIQQVLVGCILKKPARYLALSMHPMFIE